MLTSLFNNVSSNIDLASILLCTVTSLILGIVVAFTHALTSKSSKNFLVGIANFG